MIKFSDCRTKPGGDVYPSSRTVKPSKALDILTNCELAFGGHIVSIEPTRVETRTVVMGCVDQSIFEGTEEEMRLLVEMATATQEVRQLRNQPSRPADDGTKGDIHRLANALAANTGATKVAAISLLGELSGLEGLGRVSALGLDDITSVLGLIADGEATREEALSLI